MKESGPTATSTLRSFIGYSNPEIFTNAFTGLTRAMCRGVMPMRPHLAPLNVHEVVQVAVVPRSQFLHTPTH